jgi:hypothetical protein
MVNNSFLLTHRWLFADKPVRAACEKGFLGWQIRVFAIIVRKFSGFLRSPMMERM